MGRKSLIVVILTAFCAVAHAEPPPVLYPGSRCYPLSRDGAKRPPITLEVPTLAIPATEAAEANAEHELLGRCAHSLADCRRAKGSESKWWVASRWLAVGAAVGAAFVAGVWVGR